MSNGGWIPDRIAYSKKDTPQQKDAKLVSTRARSIIAIRYKRVPPPAHQILQTKMVAQQPPPQKITQQRARGHTHTHTHDIYISFERKSSCNNRAGIYISFLRPHITTVAVLWRDESLGGHVRRFALDAEPIAADVS